MARGVLVVGHATHCGMQEGDMVEGLADEGGHCPREARQDAEVAVLCCKAVWVLVTM